MDNGNVDKLLSFQIFLASRVKFSYFVIFSASVFGKVGSTDLLYLLKVLFIIITVVIILFSPISTRYQSPVRSGSHQEITEINPST
jgi:hypothetical protein